MENTNTNAAADTSTDESQVEGNEAEGETIDWQARALAAENALVKSKKASKEIKGRQEKKGSDEGQGQDHYKKLWESETAARTKLVERTKRADVNNAAQARLAKAGIKPDAMEAALGLIDVSTVEWDEDNGVDETDVNAAVATLKTKFKFMFEGKVSPTGVKPAADGRTGGNDNEMTRKDFDKLPAKDKAARIAKGLKVVD